MKRIIVLFSILTSIAMFAFAHAQTQYDYDFVGPKQNPYEIGQNNRCGPQGDGSYILCESTGGIINQTQRNFASFLREMYALAFILAGTVAFVRIVYGGVLYSWSGVVDRKKEAISIFKNVAIGMGLLMGSYAVLNTINPALTMLKLPAPVEGIVQSSQPQAKIGDPISAEMRTVMERASREMTGDIDLLEAQINGLNPTTDKARIAELNAQIEKTRSTQRGVEYQLGTEERLNQLNKGMTTDQMFKSR